MKLRKFLSIKLWIQKLVKLLIEYMQKYYCKKGLTIWKEVAMIRNWCNYTQSLALETKIGLNQNSQIDIMQRELMVIRSTKLTNLTQKVAMYNCKGSLKSKGKEEMNSISIWLPFRSSRNWICHCKLYVCLPMSNKILF